MTKENIIEEIIIGYRQTIASRYQYQNIKANFELPKTITKVTVDELRHYFLDYIYPDFEKRQELNAAFESLDDYIKHPHKLFGILKDAFKLVFKYGRHLPKILSAGLDAMKTFQAATKFENNMVTEAIKNKIEAPYVAEKIDALIKLLSREEIDQFIASSETLFDILHDRALIKKIKEVLLYLILMMKKKPQTYSQNQIKGLEIGYELIIEGDKLFTKLSAEDQKNFVHLITEIETRNLDRIFEF